MWLKLGGMRERIGAFWHAVDRITLPEGVDYAAWATIFLTIAGAILTRILVSDTYRRYRYPLRAVAVPQRLGPDGSARHWLLEITNRSSKIVHDASVMVCTVEEGARLTVANLASLNDAGREAGLASAAGALMVQLTRLVPGKTIALTVSFSRPGLPSLFSETVRVRTEIPRYSSGGQRLRQPFNVEAHIRLRIILVEFMIATGIILFALFRGYLL